MANIETIEAARATAAAEYQDAVDALSAAYAELRAADQAYEAKLNRDHPGGHVSYTLSGTFDLSALPQHKLFPLRPIADLSGAVSRRFEELLK